MFVHMRMCTQKYICLFITLKGFFLDRPNVSVVFPLMLVFFISAFKDVCA